MKNILFFLIISILSSCSYLTKKFEQYNEKPNENKAANAKKLNYCPTNSKLQYISEDEYTSKFYKNFHPNLFENKNLSFIEKAIMFSLVEMSRRPDEASPYSRLQIYLKQNGKSYYYDFRPKNIKDDTQMPFIKGMDYLTNKFVHKKSLLSLASELDSIIPKDIGVSLGFEKFLKDNSSDLLNNDELAKRFFKGDEAITRYETFDRINYKNIIQQYLLVSSHNDKYEFDKNGLNANTSDKENYKTNCNYDLSKETSLHDEIMNNKQNKSHYFALKDGDHFFLAVSSNSLQKPFKTAPKMAYFMKTNPTSSPLPICEFIGANQEIILFSNVGRSPIQHLQHLEAYEIDQVHSAFTLNEFLGFSRHLFLTNPDRILYESKRGRKAQLDFFLEMNFPIYHVEDMGNIFGHATFTSEKQKESILYSDDRSTAQLWCKE